MLRLSDIPSGTTVFVDANVPLAVILNEKRSAKVEAFLRRVAAREITAVTSVVVINEVFHRTLVAETCELFSVSYSAALRRLKDAPSAFRGLFKCYEATDDFMRLCDQVLALDQETLKRALRLSKDHGLLINDATHVALMVNRSLMHMASFDRDLKRVPFLKVYGVR